MKPFHTAPRHFELVTSLWQVPMSASCFAQWKRHRLSSIFRSDYHPDFGYVTPLLFEKCNLENQFEELQNEGKALYHELETHHHGLGNYILTNSHKLVILFQANLREMYHFSRLRSDLHAQWEIRDLSRKMDGILQSELPLAAKWLMGKHSFEKERTL